MSLTTTRSSGNYGTKGGGIVRSSQRKPDGSALSTPDTVHDWGHFKDSNFFDKTPLNIARDETMNPFGAELGKREMGFKCTLQERDPNKINDLRNEVRGNLYLTMRHLGTLANGNIVLAFGFGAWDPSVEFKLPGGEIPASFEGLVLDSALSLTPGELTAWTGNSTSLTSTVTIPAGDWCALVTTTVPIN